MALITCKECSAQISDKANACVKCGAPVVKKEMFQCFECEADLEKGTKTCLNCGAEQDANPKNKKQPEVKETAKPEQTIIAEEKKIVSQPAPKKRSGKKWIVLLLIALIGAIAFIYLSQNGYNTNSILNTPETIDLSVNCSQVNNLLITSEVTVTVQNNSSRTHNDVTVRLTAYDENNNIVKEKTTTFERTLEPNGSLSKPVSLPAKAKRCDCVVESSHPN